MRRNRKRNRRIPLYLQLREDKTMDDTTTDKLWKRQLEVWPQSIRLTTADVIRWCYDGKSDSQRASRSLAAVMALQYPQGVWYRFADHDAPVVGFRFGMDGGDYLSNFSYL
jgi:ribosomal protein L39E